MHLAFPYTDSDMLHAGACPEHKPTTTESLHTCSIYYDSVRGAKQICSSSLMLCTSSSGFTTHLVWVLTLVIARLTFQYRISFAPHLRPRCIFSIMSPGGMAICSLPISPSTARHILPISGFAPLLQRFDILEMQFCLHSFNQKQLQK